MFEKFKSIATPGFTGPTMPSSCTSLPKARHNHGVVFVHSLLDDYGLTPSQFRVYGHLARRAGSGEAWPAVASMAEVCRLHPQTVRAALKFLVQQKVIAREDRPGTTPLYRLTRPELWLPILPAKGRHSDFDASLPDSEAPATKRVLGTPCESNVGEGSPIEIDTMKESIHAERLLPTCQQEALEAAKLAGISENFALELYNQMSTVGWLDGCNRPIQSWPLYLKLRWDKKQAGSAGYAPRRTGGIIAPGRLSAPQRQFAVADYQQKPTDF